MNSKTAITLAALAASLALAPAAFAHGDGHGQHAATVVKEQKPWGIAGDAAQARTIEVRMGDDMRFTPDRIAVRQGDTVRIVVRNAGQVLHEMVIGTHQELQEHAALMKKFPTMEHDEPFIAHVPAGQSGEIVWNFNRAGTFEFACLVPGHFEAGMTGTIVVAAADQAALTDGEVRKVDEANGRITIRHGEIRNLDMPPMTMVFRVRDKTLLAKVKAGDKVKFAADKDADGELVVTGIELAR